MTQINSFAPTRPLAPTLRTTTTLTRPRVTAGISGDHFDGTHAPSGAAPHVESKPTAGTMSAASLMVESGQFPAGSNIRRSKTKDMGQAMANDLSLVDSALDAQRTSEGKKAVASASLRSFTKAVAADPSKRTVESYGKMVKLMEAVDPKASSDAITRELRRKYYGDHPVFMNLGELNQPSGVSPELKGKIDGLYSEIRQLQVVKGPDGKPLDIGHSLVALDASVKGSAVQQYLYTDVGDTISGALSSVGIDALGDNNPADQRGNAFGHTLARTRDTDPNARLSTLLGAP